VSRLKVACVGTGFIAGRHLAALDGIPEVELVAVADAVLERAEAAAQPLGSRAYGNGLALLAAEDLDAVWLCVPPFAHGPLERAALERGLPFFVEKPLAADLSVAQAIADDVRARGLRTAVGYHWRYLDVVEQAQHLLRGTPPQLLLGQWLDAARRAVVVTTGRVGRPAGRAEHAPVRPGQATGRRSRQRHRGGCHAAA